MSVVGVLLAAGLAAGLYFGLSSNNKNTPPSTTLPPSTGTTIGNTGTTATTSNTGTTATTSNTGTTATTGTTVPDE